LADRESRGRDGHSSEPTLMRVGAYALDNARLHQVASGSLARIV
jgi:hypothetical protein